MRILQVIETGGGGSGRHFLDLAAGLCARGHDVTAFTSPLRAEPDFAAGLAAIGGLSHVSLPMRRRVTARDAGDFLRLMGEARRLGPFDIAHGHSSKAGAFVRLMPRGVAGRRVYTPHALRTMDPDLGPGGRRVYGGIERLLARRTDALIAVSAAEARHAGALPLRRAPDIVANGIAAPDYLPRAEARAALGLDGDAFVAGFVGRLSAQKDPGRFVEAVRHAAGRAPQVAGVLIGDGEAVDGLRARAHGVPVRFAGWQRDASRLLRAFDLFVMTSRYEAMPYTLIEALHAGLPILTTDVGGAAITVEPGTNGRIFDTDCGPREIGEEIARLAHAPERVAAMGRASRAAAHGFTAEEMVRRTEALYEELIGEQPVG